MDFFYLFLVLSLVLPCFPHLLAEALPLKVSHRPIHLNFLQVCFRQQLSHLQVLRLLFFACLMSLLDLTTQRHQHACLPLILNLHVLYLPTQWIQVPKSLWFRVPVLAGVMVVSFRLFAHLDSQVARDLLLLLLASPLCFL